ncbi:hypothetical protein [uncultured Stenotrophomonas sp.]|uniref:hypothetical protein n=1 Tax=uncultured Stenotrophomonas sp. TaxID=165438 RepID=UPI0028E9BE00|nr:hypothetical protein [uncultured Stenotrophomonas sp.]
MTESEQRMDELENATRFFLRHFGTVPVFEDLPTNSRPDLCALFEGKRIGIEMTMAVDSDAAVHDSFAERVLQAAKDQHAARQKDRQHLHGRVIVTLQSGYNPRTARRNSVGALLGDLVADRWPVGKEVAILHPDDMHPEVAGVFKEVRAFSSEGATSTQWETATAWSVQPISVERLQPIIDKKNRLIADYRRMECDELWLLIYARAGKIAEAWDEAVGFDPTELQSAFDRTFFYDFWRSHELPARRLNV